MTSMPMRDVVVTDVEPRGKVTKTTSPVIQAVSTGIDGFLVLQMLAQTADAGWGGALLSVTARSGRYFGLTISIAEYFGRLGLGTPQLEHELESEPRESPQHLYLSEATMTDIRASLSLSPRLYRVRITEVTGCLIYPRALGRNQQAVA